MLKVKKLIIIVLSPRFIILGDEDKSNHIMMTQLKSTTVFVNGESWKKLKLF